MIGSFLGLLIGFGLLLLMIAIANIVITEILWFPIKTDFRGLLLQGLILLVLLSIANGICSIPRMIFSGTLTTIITFIIGAFIDGYIGKKVASLWRLYLLDGSNH